MKYESRSNGSRISTRAPPEASPTDLVIKVSSVGVASHEFNINKCIFAGSMIGGGQAEVESQPEGIGRYDFLSCIFVSMFVPECFVLTTTIMSRVLPAFVHNIFVRQSELGSQPPTRTVTHHSELEEPEPQQQQQSRVEIPRKVNKNLSQRGEQLILYYLRGGRLKVIMNGYVSEYSNGYSNGFNFCLGL